MLGVLGVRRSRDRRTGIEPKNRGRPGDCRPLRCIAAGGRFALTHLKIACPAREPSAPAKMFGAAPRAGGRECPLSRACGGRAEARPTRSRRRRAAIFRSRSAVRGWRGAGGGSRFGRRRASQHAEIVRHVAKFADDFRVPEIAGRWIARPAERQRADVAGLARERIGARQFALGQSAVSPGAMPSSVATKGRTT